jgi:SAM-dependent methyltransferase
VGFVADQLPGFFPGTGMPDADWWQALWPAPGAIVAAVGIGAGMDVIDLCSGDGWFTLPIAKIARRVTGIDIDERMLETARRRLAAAAVTNCLFVRSDAYALAQLLAQPADFVFMANAFHGVPDKLRLVRAVRAALKPAGRFAIVNWHARAREETVVLGEPRGPPTELRMAPDQTIGAVESGGLTFAELVELPPFHYGAVFQRPDA